MAAASISCLPCRLAAFVCFSMLLLLSVMGISCYNSGMESLTMLASFSRVQSFYLQFKGIADDVFQRQADTQHVAAAAALEGSESSLLDSPNAAAAAAAAAVGDDQVPSLATTSVGSPEQPPKSSSRRRSRNNRRLLYGNRCTSKDITISQGRDGTTSAGIPQYVVQIVNTCMSDCSPSNIHVHCGWFASAPLVNPTAFRRIAFDDCVVGNGRALKHGEIVRFQYANSFMYPLSFKSAQFC